MSQTASELPAGWAIAPLKDTISNLSDGSHNPPPKQPVGIPMLSARNVENGRLVFDDFRYISLSDFEAEHRRTKVETGDVLLTIVGSIGRSTVVPTGCTPLVIQRSVAVMKPVGCLPEFLSYQFRAPHIQQFFESEGKGSAQRGVYLSVLAQMPILLAPLAEQRRIVAQIEACLAEVNKAHERLARIPLVLKRFRQSVLAAACSGRLTADWREQQTDLEPASVLLERIRAERKARDGRKYHEPTALDTTDLPELPEAWEWTTPDVVCQAIVDCPHSTPKWTETGEICIRTTNFKPGQLDLREVRYVSEVTFQERTSRLVPMVGDVVYSREGGILGIACIIPASVKLCLGQRMMLMRPDDRVIRGTYLVHTLNGPYTLRIVREKTGGSASPHLNVGDIKEFPVPLPPLSEQDEILRRVDALLAVADELEERCLSTIRRIEKSTQAILAKAFRGELVPTEAELARQEVRDYETAEQLLEHIRASHAEDTPRTPKRPTRTTKQPTLPGIR